MNHWLLSPSNTNYPLSIHHIEASKYVENGGKYEIHTTHKLPKLGT